MTFLIITLIIILLLLSWKYIVRLEPAGVFTAMWCVMFVGILLLQEFFELRFYGILYLIGLIMMFSIGTFFCDSTVHPEPSGITLSFKSRLALPLMVVLLVGAMVNPIYSIVLHGFSLQALLSMQDLLNLNKGMSEMRYNGAEVHDVISQIFLVFSYTAPLLGGFCYRWSNKLTKTVCILTLIPGMFIALTQSMKMVMMTGFILWFTGFFVCSFSYGKPMRIKAKTLVYSIPLGWKQKLAFATAILHRPKIVFLDEPTSGVDPIVRREFWNLIYEAASQGVTIFVTTHYMDEAEYCGRISIMSSGQLKLVGTPAELKEQMQVDTIEDVFVKFVQR